MRKGKKKKLASAFEPEIKDSCNPELKHTGKKEKRKKMNVT